MDPPVLTTKLFVPPLRPKVVFRPHLIERLNQGLDNKLTLISAPAGFGKTTLISEWIASCRRPVAWLSLDEGENEFIRFLSYLVAALQTISPNIGEGVLIMLQSPQTLPSESLLTILINEAAAISTNIILVLDDYHLVDAKPIDNALTFLIEHLPPQIHLVIATREDPQLPLARLRARGMLTELRAADLRFSTEEAAEFLNQVMGLNLTLEDVSALESRTEGWIAGLQMAALALQGVTLQGTITNQANQEAASFIRTFTGSHHFVLDYLMEEVLQRQPDQVQRFLLRTSILNRLCGPLCDAVLGDAARSGQETLEALERANLFLVPLDQERHWYRYHHLFGDLLRQRIGTPKELPTYHIRASEWYEANGDLGEDWYHALSAEDFERAARLAEASWPGMERSFQSAAWLSTAKKVPDAVILTRPVLCVQLGWAFSDMGEPDISEVHLQNAERALAGASARAEFNSLPGSIALARAYNAQMQGNLAEVVKNAELAIQHIPEDDLYRRAQAAIMLEFTHWATGDLESSLRAIYAWIDDMQKIGNPVFGIASAFAVAEFQMALGGLGEADRALRQAIHQASREGQEAVDITAHHHLALALLAHERGDDNSARSYLQTAAELGQRTTLVDWPHRWNLAQARLSESAGKFDAALEFLDEAGRVYVKNPVPIARPLGALRARIYLKQGHLDKARNWAREREISTEDEVSYLAEFEHITLARLRLAEGSFSGVNSLLERLLALAEQQKRAGSVLEILLTQALVHQAQSNSSEALATLERALALAEPEGYLRTFVDEGEAMRLLMLDFKSAIANRAHPLLGYVKRILDFFPLPAGTGVQSNISNQTSEIAIPLSERELEILSLVAQGLSNAEISQRLYLALSTVKGHNLRIFAKLHAQNRTEAVARARELGLL